MFPIVRDAFTPSDSESGSGLFCKDKSLTKQEFKDECDINNILKRFERTGQLSDMIKENPQYGDFSDVPSYQEAFGIVSFAHEQFNALDAKVRSRFDNDPAKFLAFCTDVNNKDEMYSMGLAVKPVVQDVKPVVQDVNPVVTTEVK